MWLCVASLELTWESGFFSSRTKTETPSMSLFSKACKQTAAADATTPSLVPAVQLAAIVELLMDSGRREELAANCRRIALEEYGLEVQARRYAELYTELLDPHRASRRLGRPGSLAPEVVQV